jgi:hypothetical protein
MILQRLSHEAETAAMRYGLLTEAWRSIFHQALNASNFGYPAVTDKAIGEAFRVAETYLSEERHAAERTLSEIATEARTVTLADLQSIDASEMTERALEHLSVTRSYLVDELIAQCHRDIALMRQTMQRVSLEVSISSRSRGISERTALVEYRIGNQADLQFIFHDRHARKWASKKFVRALWRHTLLSTYNESVLFTLADHGLARARVAHEDHGAASHGMIVAIGSNSEFPTYSEIRNEVFHPNANAVLEMEKPDVHA